MARSTNSKSKPQNKLREKKIAFEYFAPQANHVHLAGSFNGWQPHVCPLKKDRSGKWFVDLPLPTGRHEYRYYVDGVWENDQRPVECIPNAFGSWNCVVTVQ